jgi:hypothetical protein
MFYSDSVTLAYSNLEAARHWWINAFDCKVADVPADWDCQLPSDLALQLSGHDALAILLSSRAEVDQAGFADPSSVSSVIFCGNLNKGHDHLTSRRVLTGPIRDGGNKQFFEVRDTEGNLIEISKEP